MSTQSPPKLPANVQQSIRNKNNDDAKCDADVIEFYSLKEIVELVTSPNVRGTQDQTVLLYTQCLYCSRKELLKVILDRLTENLENPQIQIKVVSLLRTWLKTENDFRDVKDEIGVSGNDKLSALNVLKLSPSPSTPEPAPCIDIDATFASVVEDTKVAIDNGHGTEITNRGTASNSICSSSSTNDSEMEEPLNLSPFAEYFRNEILCHTSKNEMFKKLSKPILDQFTSSRNGDSSALRLRTLSFADAPTPKIPKVKTEKEVDLIMLDPMEVARQICLAEYKIFKKIKFEEFLKQNSKCPAPGSHAPKIESMHSDTHNLSEHELQSRALKKAATDQSHVTNCSHQPNIDAMTEWFNKLVVWTQIEILYQRDFHKRCKIISCLLKICDHLERYNNISSLCAIRAGLCSAPIHRLRKTWDSIPKKHREIKAKIDELFKLGNGQKNLRDRVSIISQPAIPHLGLFLGDIVFIHDGNDTFKKCSEECDDSEPIQINWSKMKLLHDRIHWISMFQQSPFVFVPVPIITKYLQSKMIMISEDFLYKLSREVEPPQKKK